MTDFDISQLYSTHELHRKTIKACGAEFPIFVRRLPAVDLRRFYTEMTSEDKEERATAGFKAMVKAIRQEDGTPFATYDQYVKFDGEAISALMAAFTEINSAKKDDELGNA